MFMTLNIAEFRQQFAAYTLTDSTGKLLFVGVAKLTDILSLPGSFGLPPVVNIIISTPQPDLMRAANDALLIATDANRNDLVESLKKTVDAIQRPPKRAGRPIECIETGERFFSTTGAAEAHSASYSALQKHLRGLIGYKTVKGKTYRYL